jgi:hypothetical protein
MRPITKTVVGVADSAVIPVDIYLNPFSVSLQTKITGTPTYTVEWTQDDIWAVGYDPNAGSSEWNAVAGMENAVADATATFDEPLRAFRIRQTAVGDPADQTILRIVQGGAVS